MSDSGVKEEVMDEFDDITDADYRHQGVSAVSSGVLAAEAAAAAVAAEQEQLAAVNGSGADDGASIIIADASGPPSDLPVSVNIEVNFQEGKEDGLWGFVGLVCLFVMCLVGSLFGFFNLPRLGLNFLVLVHLFPPSFFL